MFSTLPPATVGGDMDKSLVDGERHCECGGMVVVQRGKRF